MLEAKQIQNNWDIFLGYIKKYITGERQKQLLDFYSKIEDILILYPASTSPKYHSCFPGGYIHHVNNVIQNSIWLYKLWEKQGVDTSRFQLEELIFVAINHDLGKIGSSTKPLYIPQDDDWRKKNLGELYKFDTSFQFMSVPDRTIYLLQEDGIKISENEFIGIKTHDGLYDSANESYLKTFLPEAKPRTSLPYIIHMADLMSARIEFEQQFLTPKQL